MYSQEGRNKLCEHFNMWHEFNNVDILKQTVKIK